MSNPKNFTVTRGQLVRFSSIQFEASGKFKPSKEYAVVTNDYSCNWTHIHDETASVKIILSGGLRKRVSPLKIEFVEDLSELEIRQKILDILLSI